MGGCTSSDVSASSAIKIVVTSDSEHNTFNASDNVDGSGCCRGRLQRARGGVQRGNAQLCCGMYMLRCHSLPTGIIIATSIFTSKVRRVVSLLLHFTDLKLCDGLS